MVSTPGFVFESWPGVFCYLADLTFFVFYLL